MKNLTVVFSCVCLLLAGACTKSSSSSPSSSGGGPSGPGTADSSSPYYFNSTFNGNTYNLNANNPQYDVLLGGAIAGGFEDANNNALFPSTKLDFFWMKKDSVTESDLMSLKGRTLYFNDTVIQPQVEFSQSLSAATWFSVDTANTSYYVKVTNIVFLKNDFELSIPVKAYVVTGSCNVAMNNGAATKTLSGTFNFIIAIRGK